MLLDCAIIGGGPAGLNAALVLGRARREVILFDDNRPRNAVTHESHGFITRDGIHPAEFRAIGQQELSKYPSVETRAVRIVSATRLESGFSLLTAEGEKFEARTILLATGLRETLPDIAGIHDYYGKSLFNCPFCDGWELRDQPLVVIVENEMGASHVPQLLYNWSHDIVLCTNGHHVLGSAQKELLHKHSIQIIEEKISALQGSAGLLKRVVFADGQEIERTGGLVAVDWSQATSLGQDLGCEINNLKCIVVDELGRTTVKGVYAAGDTVSAMASQLIHAASSGSRAASCIIMDFTQSYFGA